MPHGFRKLPRLLFLLLLAGSVLFFLAPASLRTFGPPPGLSYFKGSLPQGWKLDGQVPEDALLAEPSGDRKQPVVLDLDRFRPQKQTPGKITTSTQVAAIPALTKAARNSCPDPFRSAPLPLTKRQLDLDGCEEVATLSQDFKVSVCPALASAGVNCNNFFVVIERNDLDACEEAYKEPISMYKDNAAEIKRTTGPDTFQLFITGTERWATSQHIGYSAISAPCRYIYPVTLSNAGTFNLQIHHLWDLWHGDADFMAPKPGGKDYYTNKQKNNKGHIPLTPRKIQNALFAETDGIPSSLLPSSILCPPSCKQYAFNANPDNSVTGSLRTLSGAITRYNAQPLCSRVDAIQGAYFPDPTPVQNTSLPIVQYRWHPLGCKLSPKNSLMLDGKNGIAARKQCLGEKQRTIVFDGDSHTRISYDALMPRLRGDGEGKPVYVRLPCIVPKWCFSHPSLTCRARQKLKKTRLRKRRSTLRGIRISFT